MPENVIISMQTVQDCDETDPETLDFITDGYYQHSSDFSCVTYDESEVTGMPGTRTSVMILPDQVIVDRDGSVTSRMVFREGEKSDFLYRTPFGEATMGIRTRKIRHSFDAGGGHADIEYVIDVDHTVFSKNRFTIDVHQAGGRTNA